LTSDPLGDYATLGGAVATAGLLVVAIVVGLKAACDIREQIDTQRAIQRKQRVFELQGAFSSREFAEMSAAAADVIELFRANRSAAMTTWEHHTSREKAMMALAVLNFYELVAAEYNAESFDRATADSYMGYAAVIMWEYAEPFTEYLRENDSTFFVEWKYFVENYRDKVIAAARQHDAATHGALERGGVSDGVVAGPHGDGGAHGERKVPGDRQARIRAIDEVLTICREISSEVSACRNAGTSLTAEQRSRLESNLQLASAKSDRLEPSGPRAKILISIRTAQADITAPAETTPDIAARLAAAVADVEQQAKALKAR
jgi:hypothetical protein